jgi:ParB-like chromosome segregation protein Spo0J
LRLTSGNARALPPAVRGNRFLEDNRIAFLAEKSRQEDDETEARRERAAAWRDVHERRMAELRDARLSAKREEAATSAGANNLGSGDGVASETSDGSTAAASPWARVLALVDAPGERAHSHASQARARALYATMSRRAQVNPPSES